MTHDCIIFNDNQGNLLVGLGIESYFEWRENDTFNALDQYIQDNSDRFVCSIISYDFKNRIENLNSNNFDGTHFPELLFWAPQVVVEIEPNSITTIKGLLNSEQTSWLKTIQKELLIDENCQSSFGVNLQARTSHEDYIKNVQHLKDHIQQGDIYEINYCQEFYAENIEIDTYELYKSVNQTTHAPFSVYFSIGQYEGISGSPERFVKKEGQHLISQPIKGTIKRGKTKEEDFSLVNQLKNDPKEISENVMIVDLVRNDLSKIAQKGSVKVDELFWIYSFKTVHQMISTVSCTIDEEVAFSDILKALFPMGSMTGAPKISAMKLSEKYEDFKRGLYSGSIGIIDPNGNFDYNVVIRSILYNKETKYLNCPVGGAITIESDPQREFEECETKIGAIKNLLK